jgi:hypothetical protein
MALSITQSKVLLVEGKDEENFFKALFNRCGLQYIDIWVAGGKDKFPAELEAFLLSPNIGNVESYAIIRDADDDRAAAFQSIVALLKNQNEPYPMEQAGYGSNEKRCVGVFIMPGNQEEGMLEDLCLMTVAEHPAMRCVEGYIACLEQALAAKQPGQSKESGEFYFPKNRSKARAQAFMASMHESVNAVGLAAQKGAWNLDHPILNDLKSFIKTL